MCPFVSVLGVTNYPMATESFVAGLIILLLGSHDRGNALPHCQHK